MAVDALAQAIAAAEAQRNEAVAGKLKEAYAHQQKEDREAGLKAAREALLLSREAGDKKVLAAAQEACAALRAKPAAAPAQPAKEAPLGLSRQLPQCVPGVSGPRAIREEPYASCYRVVGSAESKSLSGMVTLLTGASRGIGKGISLMLAEAGAIVYVTGRSSPGKVTDILLMGTVDETAAAFAKLGGIGVATHVDHAQDAQNRALANLIANNHGRLDCLVNNAFYIPKPDLVFFSTPIWAQPIRFLNEQIAVGGFNHAAQTLMFLPCLRRGKGVVINISSWGSQTNIGVFPASYVCNKAAFDRSMAALSEKLRNYNVHVMTLWPGNVKSERSVMGAKRTGAKLVDMETTRFTGEAVVKLAGLRSDELFRFSSAHRTISSADIARFETDGYMHQGNLHTFSTGGRTSTS